MDMKKEFSNLMERLKTERDELKLKAHLASMEAKEEFAGAEEKWEQLKLKVAEIGDDAVDTSHEHIAKAKIVGDELKQAYKRIAAKLDK